MKKHKSMVNKILLMIIITGLILGAVIITAGAYMIYNATESGIESEIRTAGQTFANLYDAEYDGDLYYDGVVCRAGDIIITEDDFKRINGYISCENDVDFTLFHSDTRVFTSVKNVDGSFAVGTKAADDVTKNVLKNGKDYLNMKVLVNDTYYMGYYVPINAQNGDTIGMLFAGKPLETAKANAINAVVRFIVLTLATLFCALGICFFRTRKMLADYGEINRCLATLSDGDFSVKLADRILKRNDEIGDTASHVIKLRENLRDMVERDPLTTLYNRRCCRSRLESLAAHGNGYCAVMGDIDHFKNINDTYGHAAGDYVLKSISALIKSHCHQNGGFAARWGGEEFLIIFPNFSADDARLIIDALLTEIRSSDFNYEGTKIDVTMTFGISRNIDGESCDSTIKRADELLYDGKTSGRNRIMV